MSVEKSLRRNHGGHNATALKTGTRAGRWYTKLQWCIQRRKKKNAKKRLPFNPGKRPPDEDTKYRPEDKPGLREGGKEKRNEERRGFPPPQASPFIAQLGKRGLTRDTVKDGGKGGKVANSTPPPREKWGRRHRDLNQQSVNAKETVEDKAGKPS